MKLTITDITSIFAMIVSVVAFIECRRLSKLGEKNTKLIVETNDDVQKLAESFKGVFEYALEQIEKERQNE